MTDRSIMLRAISIGSIRTGKRTHLCMSAFLRPLRRPNEAPPRLDLPSPWTKLEVGDRLWVQEDFAGLTDRKTPMGNRSFYAMELPGGHVPVPGGVRGDRYTTQKFEAKQMPRDFSRYTLIVEAVTRFRVQDFTWAMAKAEGLPTIDPYQTLGQWWEKAYGFTMPWKDNGEAVGIAFRFMDGNIDTGEVWTPPTYAELQTKAPALGRGLGAWPVND